MLLEQKGNKLRTLDLSENVAVNIQGEILFEKVPVKDVVLTFFVQGSNGQNSCTLGKTTTTTNGYFSLCAEVPLSYAWREIGVRICSYLKLPDTKVVFPLFFGVESFTFYSHKQRYHLGEIPLRLGWSFCDRPLLFKGYAFRNNLGNIDPQEKIIRLKTKEGKILNETTTDLDGSYNLLAYGDGVLKKREDVILEVEDGQGNIKKTTIPLNAKDHVYYLDVKIP